MKSKKKRCSKGAADELVHNVVIKQEGEGLAEESHAPNLAHQEITNNKESLRSIKTEEDVSHTGILAHEVHDFTPAPQTDELIKTELILDEEFRDETNGSEANCRQNALALADELDLNAGSSTQTSNQRILATAHGPRAISSISQKETQEFPCDLCERTFSKKSSLTNHKTAHAKGHVKIKTSEFVCEVCGAYFTQKGNLNVHMVRKHLSKAQSKTPGPQTADDSISSHTEEFIDGDAASFGQEGVAQGNESKSDTKSEACEVCHCLYPTAYMRAHMRLAHSWNQPKHKFIRFECEFCSRTFKEKHHLKKHLRTHAEDGKQEFPCHLCKRTFSKKSSLTSHKRAHTKKVCEVCGSTFASRRNLKIHMVKKHLDTVLSIAAGSQTGDDDAIHSQMEEHLDEESTSYIRASPENTALGSEIKSHVKSEACEICHCIYPTEYIRIHVRLAHSKSKHRCDLCPRSFQNKRGLVAHIDETHSTNRKQMATSLACEVCLRLFKNKYSLKKHLSTHATDRKRKFACDICEKGFYQKDALRKHKQIYAQKDHPKFHCEMCGFSFPTKGNLEEHMLSTHVDKQKYTATGLQITDNSINQTKIEEPTCECGVCSRSFKSRDLLMEHLNIHQKDTNRKFCCNFCDCTFYKKVNLLKHRKTHNRGTYHCKWCGKVFTRRESLQVHMLRLQHFGHKPQLTPQPSIDVDITMKKELMSDEEFIDEDNGKDSVSHVQGPQKSALAADDWQCARVATAEEGVSCEVCHNTYPQELIKTHMRIMHGVREHKCPFCPKVCSQESNLKNHINTHNKNRTRHACEQCGVTLSSKGSLKKHMITQHSKTRKPEFNCELCEKIFYTKSGLKAHGAIHAGVTFSCEVCEARFTRKPSLKKHMLLKHKAKTQPFTPDPQIANCDSVYIKEEFKSDEEILEEETYSSLT